MDVYSQIALAFLAIAIFAQIALMSKSFYPPFYIVAGLFLGPAALNLVTYEEIINIFGEIGVVFLLFYLGHEFSINTLITKKKTLVIAGLTDFTINFGLGLLIGRTLGLQGFYIIVMAGIIYMSSSGIITKKLIHLNAVKDPEGELIMGIMVFEDLAMVIFLVIVTTFSGMANKIEWLVLGKDVVMALIFCGTLIYLGKKYQKYLDRFIKSDSKEVTTLSFLALLFMVTAIGHEMGVSRALGGFFLGMAMSESKYISKIEGTALRFRDIFGSMFFFSFGLNFKVEHLSISVVVIGIALTLAVLGKIVSSILISKFLKCSINKGLFIGLVTISRGEFSLLISGIVSNESFNFQTFSVVLILFTSLISTVGLRIFISQQDKKEAYLIPSD